MVGKTYTFILLAVMFAGCATYQNKPTITTGFSDRDTMKSTLRSYVPEGTPVSVAMQSLQREGFSCSVVRNESFYEEDGSQGSVDYIFCDRSDYEGVLLSRRWTAKLYLENDQVSEIFVTTGLIGP